jgi:hypothetical protein
MWNSFWSWYERTYTLNISVALGLFALQIVHLIWLTAEVVWGRAFGEPLFELQGMWQWIIIVVDYTEIPALLSVSLVYINELRQSFNWKSVMYLAFLNSQWLHILWITDEFVVASLAGTAAVALPVWLAWMAILIDYLEIPVMIDTFKKFFAAVRQNRVEEFLKYELREEE